MQTSDPVLVEILNRLQSIEDEIKSLQPLKELYVGGKMATKIVGVIITSVVGIAGFIVWVKSNLSIAIK